MQSSADYSGIPHVDVPDEVLDKLRKAALATVAGCVVRAGFAHPFLTGLVPRISKQNFVGRAFTARLLPVREDLAKVMVGDNSLHRRAFETIGKNQVLVFDARGDTSAAVSGDVLATRLLVNGAVALVTDGSTRDLVAMEQVGLPLFSRGVHSESFGTRHFAADLNSPIQCAGVTILPGDVLVGDAEGVCLVPQGIAAQVADAALEQELQDEFVLAKIRSGAPLKGTFPPEGETKAEYEAWRKKQG